MDGDILPFKSKAQQGKLFAKKPKLAAKFAKKTSKEQFKKLPEKVKKNVHLLTKGFPNES